jgi:type II secretory pathway pseudopilin PulG
MRDGKDNTIMELAGVAGAGKSGEGRSRLDDRGFVLVALLVAMAISAVWLGTMLPAWRQQAVRQREADLVFRGQQYARAIALYFVNDNCTLPADADVLVSRHYLRKRWKDPIANADFVPLMAGGAASPTGTGASPSTPGRPPGSGPVGGSQLVGLYGVSSKSTDTSIMVYQNQQQYSMWSFRYTDALQKMGRAANCNNQNQPGGTPGPGKGPARPGGPPTGGPGGSGPGVGNMPGGFGGAIRSSGQTSGPPPPGLSGTRPGSASGGSTR